MASTLTASGTGLEIIDRARRHKGWNKTEVAWQVRADVSKSTLDRFWMQKPIKHQNLVAICKAVGIDWEQVIDLPEIEPTNIARRSNLAQVNQPVVLELEEFGQQIFDWFGALDFKSEGFPRQESNYVEWIIQVPQRRAKFDRVLIRATIHEAGLSDLNSLRWSVAQLRVDEGWLVANLWVSQSVRQTLSKSDDENLTCLTFDELIDQDADFTPYLDWLEREISKREIDRYYVDLGCTKGEFDADTRSLRGTSKYSVADGGIDRYIDRWLENPVTEHVSILGEFGTGKTWFAFHYAGKCLQAYRDAKSKGMPRPRLPLVIPLRDYAKALNVENVLAGFFYTQQNIRLNSEVFDRLNRMGKLLLIFDGFDEMADKIDTQKMTDNFWELAKVVTTNAKVILTCRTEHFPTAQDGRENLGGERIPSNAKIAVAPKFETLELLKFDDGQIREVLSRRTNGATVKLVMANSQLLDLLRRAVMAEFVLEALPEIEAGKKIDLARVYLYAVRHKMERDITTGRTFTSLADKLYFLCELAWEMLSEDKMTLNYREFPDRLKLLFGKEVESQKHLDHWHYDMMGQTMLIRNDDGDYSPAHRSLLEFFVAYKFAAELGLLADDFLELARSQSGIDESLSPAFYPWSSYWRRDMNNKGEIKLVAPLARFESEPPEKLRNTFGKSPLTKAVIDLLLPMLNLELKYREQNLLLDLIKSTKATEVGCLGGNAATLLVRLNPDAIEYQDLSMTNLDYADLSKAGLKGSNLSGATLENSLMAMVFRSANSIVMSKDDRQFITAHNDNCIRIWDRYSGKEIEKLVGHKSSVNAIVLSQDGQLLYSGSNDLTIKEWKLADGVCQQTFNGHRSSVNAIALSQDGQLLYSSGNDRTIKEWELVDGICQYTIEDHHSSVNAIVLSKDGQLLYSGGNDLTIKEWKLVDGVCQRTFKSHQDWVRTIALSQDGQLLYSGSGDRTIKAWKITDGSCQHTFKGHQDWVRTIALSQDGQLLYSGSDDRTIKAWKITDGSCQRTFEGHQDWVRTIALSQDGQLLYSGSGDRTIKEWKITDGSCQRTFEGHQDWVRTIALSQDGQLLYSGSGDRTIKEWKITDGSCQRTFEGHQDWVRTIVLSQDGQLLYSGSDDRTIKAWKITDGSCQHTFKGHHGSIWTIDLSADGQLLYSGSDDGTIKAWDVSTGECLRTIDTRLCAGANITNVKGLTPAQTDALLALGAFSTD
jgi:predicted NACHT family NTPase/DNA-binding Xre family transcriptional regulator